jgi:hypothetical protein
LWRDVLVFGPVIILESVARDGWETLTWALYALLLASLSAYFGFCLVILRATLQIALHAGDHLAQPDVLFARHGVSCSQFTAQTHDWPQGTQGVLVGGLS